MLTKSAVEEAIRSGDIRIHYSFVPGKDRSDNAEYLGEALVDLENGDSPATQMFNANFFGARLRLTLGPVVKTHNSAHRRNRRWNDWEGCYDLRANGDQIRLEAHEIISVSTNERIGFSGGFSALILPRLTNADAGLLYVPSYIDPYWDGLLQGAIVNLTDRPQVLRLCEPVAICFFFGLGEDVPEAIKNGFPVKSHHYGQNWPKVLEQGGDPFPARKRPEPEATLRPRMKRAGRYLANHVFQAVTTVGLAALFLGCAVLYSKISASVTLQQDMAEAQTAIAENAGQIGALKLRIPRSGTLEVHIPEGRVEGETTFTVSGSRVPAATLWVEETDPEAGNFEVSGTSHPDPSDPDTTVVTVYVKRLKSGPTERVPVKWLLAQ